MLHANFYVALLNLQDLGRFADQDMEKNLILPSFKTSVYLISNVLGC